MVEVKKRAYEEWLRCRTRENYDIYRAKKVEVKLEWRRLREQRMIDGGKG